jgi:hypothetical protein
MLEQNYVSLRHGKRFLKECDTLLSDFDDIVGFVKTGGLAFGSPLIFNIRAESSLESSGYILPIETLVPAFRSFRNEQTLSK